MIYKLASRQLGSTDNQVGAVKKAAAKFTLYAPKLMAVAAELRGLPFHERRGKSGASDGAADDVDLDQPLKGACIGLTGKEGL